MNLSIMENKDIYIRNRKSIILILNRDDVLFLKPLDKFLNKNSFLIKHIYYTSFLLPNHDNRAYVLANIRISNKFYLLKYMTKLFLKKVGCVFPLPLEKKRFLSIKTLAEYYSIPCSKVKDINNVRFLAELRVHKAEFVLSNTSQIYKKKILRESGLKFYNFHPSLLPMNKGRFPIFWAIMNGDKQGITCHEIDEKIDHGKIISQIEIDVGQGKTVEEVMEIILEHTADFMNDSLQIILEGNIQYLKPIIQSSYGPIPNRDDIKKYRRIIIIS